MALDKIGWDGMGHDDLGWEAQWDGTGHNDMGWETIREINALGWKFGCRNGTKWDGMRHMGPRKGYRRSAFSSSGILCSRHRSNYASHI